MTDSALAFVGQIITAYNAAEKAGASALSYALECGKYLNLAKGNVIAEKGKWKGWREKNLPTVSEETERLYRRLADAVAEKENVFEKCKSIRDAIKYLSGLDGNLNQKPAKPRSSSSKTGSSATGLSPPDADTPSTGLEAELENAAAGEIINSIQDDADKLEEVVKASIAKLTPDKVCGALTKAWGADQLRDLTRRLNTYLSTLHSTPQSTPPRRPLVTPGPGLTAS
jgi:hypothetical protein